MFIPYAIPILYNVTYCVCLVDNMTHSIAAQYLTLSGLWHRLGLSEWNLDHETITFVRQPHSGHL